MTFKFKHRGENSTVRRTFACDDCAIEWTQWQNRDDPIPECPHCAAEALRAVTSPALLSNKSRAVDFAQDTMEAMGYSDFNDNQRPGDIAAKGPRPVHTAEREAQLQAEAEITRALEVQPLSETPQMDTHGRPVEGGLSPAQMGGGFWGGEMPGVPAPMAPAVGQAFQGAAMANSRVARAEGVDPMELLHKKKPPFKLDIVAAHRPRTV